MKHPSGREGGEIDQSHEQEEGELKMEEEGEERKEGAGEEKQ